MQNNKDFKFEDRIPEIEDKIGYKFTDRSLLCQAFTRTSYCNEHKGKGGSRFQSNEVLEFFGDSVLSTAIVTLLMRDFSERYEHGISTELKEGDFSNIRSKLSDKKNLSDATRVMGLEKFLQMGEGDSRLGIENEPSVMEDLFESIIGAIYIDSGNDLNAVIKSVSKMLDVQKYFSKATGTMQSYKNALQEWCADKKHRLPPPVYKTISESGPDHKKIYERACYIGEKIYGTGCGKNQKLADSAAAEAALKFLTKSEETKKKREEKSAPTEASVTKLRAIAAKEKKASPEFRDLGETVRSTEEKKEYEIECRFAGINAIGTGQSKKEAKIVAADKVLSAIEKKNAPAVKKKIGGKKTTAQKNTNEEAASKQLLQITLQKKHIEEPNAKKSVEQEPKNHAPHKLKLQNRQRKNFSQKRKTKIT